MFDIRQITGYPALKISRISGIRIVSISGTQNYRYPISFFFIGKVAVVTASTEGIGFAIAKRLATDGAKVVISSRKVQLQPS